MKQTYTRGEVIELLVKERKRARDIAYEFKDEYEYKAKAYKNIGLMKKTNEQLADSARIIGNTISGSDALSATLGETIKDRIIKELEK